MIEGVLDEVPDAEAGIRARAVEVKQGVRYGTSSVDRRDQPLRQAQ